MIAIGQMTNGVNKLRNGVKMIVEQVAHTVSQLYDALESNEYTVQLQSIICN